MKQETYNLLENYMLECMGDSAHDKDHIYRVLYNAMDIAQAEQNVDYDVLICACLLHDIGRKEQFENPKLCHAMVGGEKAYRFLIDNHFCKDFADKVKHCIQTHRYRQNNPPRRLKQRFCLTLIKSTQQVRWELQEHCFTKELSVSRCIHFCRTAEFPTEQTMKSLLFFKSINTSLKNCMIVSIQKEEMKLQRNARKPLLRSIMLCSKRSVIHMTEDYVC